MPAFKTRSLSQSRSSLGLRRTLKKNPKPSVRSARLARIERLALAAPLARPIPDIRVGQRRQVYDRAFGNRWYVDITDEFLHGIGLERRNGISINVTPNLNRGVNGVILVNPLQHPRQDLVIGDIYAESDDHVLDVFPLDEQIHYGFLPAQLARQHEHMDDDDAAPDQNQLEWVGGQHIRRHRRHRRKSKSNQHH